MPITPDQNSALQPFQFTMTDDALVTFDLKHVKGTAAPFHDVGYMPVNSSTLAGNPLFAGLDGVFIRYDGDGVQDFTTGAITYKSLHYELVGYQGQATFPPSTGSEPTVGGTTNQFVLASGDLIKNSGNLQFAGGVTGEVDASVKIGGKTVGELDISVTHAAADVTILGVSNGFPTALTLYGGTLQGTFKPLSV